MTVTELIRELEQINGDKEVYVNNDHKYLSEKIVLDESCPIGNRVYIISEEE